MQCITRRWQGARIKTIFIGNATRGGFVDTYTDTKKRFAFDNIPNVATDGDLLACLSRKSDSASNY